MTTILLVIHLLLAIALVGMVLLQRSEGGGLGIGGGSVSLPRGTPSTALRTRCSTSRSSRTGVGIRSSKFTVFLSTT